MEKSLKKRIVKYIISILIFIGLTAYLTYHIFFAAAKNIVTEIASPVTEEVTLSCDGYIMRNESVLQNGNNSASVAYYFDDGTKISKNARVASVYTGENTGHGNVLINIDKNIDFLQKSNIDTLYQTSDTSTVDARLSELYYDIRTGLEDDNISGVISSSENMLMFLNRRMVITGEISGFDSKIEMLEKERDSYSATLGTSSSSIYADRSGYFYSSCDGFENIFTADAVQTMSYDDFISYTEMSPEDTSTAAGKIAYDYTWYLTCPVNKSELKHFTLSHNYGVIFEANSNSELNMKLTKIISDTDGNGALLVFESNDCPADFHFSRMQPVKLIKSSVSGIKIPISALRVVDGQSGVYILYGSKVRFRGFEIIAQNENYYIASLPGSQTFEYTELKVYDNIIVSGKDIYEDKVVN